MFESPPAGQDTPSTYIVLLKIVAGSKQLSKVSFNESHFAPSQEAVPFTLRLPAF